MSDFNSTIVASSKELTTKEKFALSHESNAIALDKALIDENSEPIIIDVAMWVQRKIHNDNARMSRPDYEDLILVDKNGLKYSSGSDTLIRNFKDCWEAIEQIRKEGDEAMLQVFKKPSRNNVGKCFITCTIV
jgi:hypothetical protein